MEKVIKPISFLTLIGILMILSIKFNKFSSENSLDIIVGILLILFYFIITKKYKDRIIKYYNSNIVAEILFYALLLLLLTCLNYLCHYLYYQNLLEFNVSWIFNNELLMIYCYIIINAFFGVEINSKFNNQTNPK